MRNRVPTSLCHLRAARVSLVRAAKALFAWNVCSCSESVLLNTMPKSGSVYIREGLARILNLKPCYLGARYALIDQIDIDKAMEFSRGGYVSQNHLAASPENVQLLKHFKLKMILHLRDPRQALLSWIYHLDYITRGEDQSIELLYFIPRTPSGYFDLSMSDKIDWQIDNYLPQLVAWASRWIAIADSGCIPVLITHQEELRTNEKIFFDSILSFHNIDDLTYSMPNVPRTMKDTHFRLADPTEWIRTFTPDQTLRATSEIPSSLQERFGWQVPR